MTLDFQPFPKIARLNRNITITEKLDGTNAAVVIVPVSDGEVLDANVIECVQVQEMGDDYQMFAVCAQSRTRFITPGKGTDNYGFAGWVQENAKALVETLGEGTHYGEWWGAGIQRRYGLTGSDKRFSLFNTARWASAEFEEDGQYGGRVPGLSVVPVLYEGPFSQGAIENTVADLRAYGSAAARSNTSYGFDRPEGIVVHVAAARTRFKVTLEGDEAPKGIIGHAKDEEHANLTERIAA